jgi:hypothetical protein
MVPKRLVIGNLAQKCALDIANADTTSPCAIAHAFTVALQKHSLLVLVGKGACALMAIVAEISCLACAKPCLEIA